MNIRNFLALGLCMGIVGAEAQESRDVLIIESTVAEFEPGQTVSGRLEVQLKVGESLRVLRSDGETAVLEGPYAGPVEANLTSIDLSMVDAKGLLDRLFGPQRIDQGDLGGVRGVDAIRTPAPPSPWLIPVESHQVHCVREPGTDARLWRSGTGEERLSIVSLTTRESATITWQTGVTEVSWPEKLPIIEDEMYLIRQGDDLMSRNVRIRFVSAELPEDLRLALWFAAKGCDVQALHFAEASQISP